MNSRTKIKLASVVIIIMLGLGTAGFKLLTDWTWFESFYFTLITITTIGYGEPPSMTDEIRYFSTFLIILGVGSLGYALSVVVQSVISSEVIGSLGKRRMMKALKDLNSHYIVCGAGRVGRRVSQEITAHGMDCVIIEYDEGKAELLSEQGYRVMLGDATSEETLKNAGIERAQGLVCAVASDPENLYITLTARDLNKNLFIVARANEESALPRLTRAGADRVVSPVITGSHQMSQMLLKPAVADFIELATMAEELSLEIEQVEIEPDSAMIGRSLKDAQIHTQYDVMVIAIKRVDAQMIFNPAAETTIQAQDALIVLGSHDNMERLEKEANPTGPSRRYHNHRS